MQVLSFIFLGFEKKKNKNKGPCYLLKVSLTITTFLVLQLWNNLFGLLLIAVKNTNQNECN